MSGRPQANLKPLDVSPLFQPLSVRQKVLRNRIVMPPMVVLRGLTTPEGIEWYGRHAQGRVGLVIVEATGVSQFGTAFTAENLRPLTQAIHAGGALAAIQLFPSSLDSAQAPAQLSRKQLAQMLEDYRVAAETCAGAGFDGIEPHGAHGYLLNQFFSPVQNQRSDEYGGSPDNRMRLALEIVSSIRTICDKHEMILLYRHTPVGQGYGIEESLVLGRRLVEAGVDVLDISPASINQPGDRSAPFRDVGVPIIAVNELDRISRALEVLNEGRADLIAIGRGLIADPDWPIKVKSGEFDEIIECTYCDEKCFGNLRQGIPVECTQWE